MAQTHPSVKEVLACRSGSRTEPATLLIKDQGDNQKEMGKATIYLRLYKTRDVVMSQFDAMVRAWCQAFWDLV